MPGPEMRLLLVEDSAGDARILEAMLQGRADRVDITWVKTLDEGVKRLMASTFDAVLLDLSLPDSDGVAGVATTHLFDTETPIIVLTGLDDDHAAIEALRSGAQDYLVKGTVDGDDLLRTIRFAQQRAGFQRALAEQRPPVAEAQDDKVVRALVCPSGGGLVPALADYASGIVDAGRTLLYVTFDRPARVLRDRFSKDRGALDGTHFVDASGQGEAEEEGHVFVVDGDDGLDHVAVEVERACAALGPDTHVVLDSINSVIMHHGIDQAAVFCHTLANRLRLLHIGADLIGHDNHEWPFIADRFGFLDGEAALVGDDGATAPPDPSFV